MLKHIFLGLTRLKEILPERKFLLLSRFSDDNVIVGIYRSVATKNLNTITIYEPRKQADKKFVVVVITDYKGKIINQITSEDLRNNPNAGLNAVKNLPLI